MSSALSRACSALAAPSAGTPLVLPPIAALLNPFPRAGGTVGGSPAPAGTLTAGWGLLRSARKDMAGLRAASQACSALAALLRARARARRRTGGLGEPLGRGREDRVGAG